MKFENSCVVAAPCANLWDFMTVIPNVAPCLPGVEEVHALEDGSFSGIQQVKIGIVKMRLSGKISIEQMDQEHHSATMAVQAAEQRISGLVKGTLTMHLEAIDAQHTKLTVQTDLGLFGKIGEFGQSIIKKKADQMMAEFAQNVAVKVTEAMTSSGQTT